MDKKFVSILLVLMSILCTVFLFFPRSTRSYIERRDLLRFPQFSAESFLSGRFTSEVSSWFSDSEPYRDRFLTISRIVKDVEAIKLGIASEPLEFYPERSEDAPKSPLRLLSDKDLALGKLFTCGIIIQGSSPNARGYITFGGSAHSSVDYGKVLNQLASKLDEGVRCYCMPVPTAAEFYCPEQARMNTFDQRSVIDTLIASLDDKVCAIDVCDVLLRHKDEDIYLRTDHHWSPLGAFYAAREFARIAQVTLPDLKDFDTLVAPPSVGSLYRITLATTLLDSPEEVTFFLPKEEYEANYLTFDFEDEYVIKDSTLSERKGPFFVKDVLHRGGFPYSIFMGGDNHIVSVRGSQANGRRLLIVKDSFGNAIPGFLFASFEETHIIDYRFFPFSFYQYVKSHSITDILFVNNTGLIKPVRKEYARWFDRN